MKETKQTQKPIHSFLPSTFLLAVSVLRMIFCGFMRVFSAIQLMASNCFELAKKIKKKMCGKEKTAGKATQSVVEYYFLFASIVSRSEIALCVCVGIRFDPRK